jgi:hypothetical protein
MACEETLCDEASLRRFVDIDLGREPVPDSITTTITKYQLQSTTVEFHLPVANCRRALDVMAHQDIKAFKLARDCGAAMDASVSNVYGCSFVQFLGHIHNCIMDS